MNEQRASKSNNAKPKLWESGEPYRYPLPKPDGDPWDILFQPYLKADKLQCDAWKEEVHYLLIFAGLFSVVLAVFVLHSIQSLQLSANDVSANILARVADRLDSIAINGTSSSSSNATSAVIFSAPSRFAVRVSILWFISFILSLSTLLVGILILQWIREHQRYSDGISLKDAVAVYHMRREALKRWYIPQIISGLPLLLLLAVIFFFAGIILYLFTINLTLAITITVFIGIIFIFLILTTLLPTLQGFILTLSEPSRKKAIPTPCPYKSPQSWALYYSIAWIFRYSFSWGWRMRYIPLAVFVKRHYKSWETFDAWWILLRSTYSQFIHGVFDPSSDTVDTKSPGFDESQILIKTMEKYSETSKTVLAAYHCFQDVSKTALSTEHEKELELEELNSPLRKRNQLLHMQYWNKEHYGKRTAASNRIDTSTVHKMHDENLMLFLWLPGSRLYPDPIARGMASHLLELQSRVLRHMMTQGSLEDAYIADDRQELWLSRIYKQYKPSSPTTHSTLPWTVALYRRVSHEVTEDSLEQYVLILDAFFRKYSSEVGLAWTLSDLQVNVYARTAIQNFLVVPLNFRSHLFGSFATTPAATQFRATLAFVASVLQSSWTRTEKHERYDFLFFSMTYFLSWMFSSAAGSSSLVDGGYEDIPLDLLQSLSLYETTIDKEIWGTIFTGNYSLGDWSRRLQASKARPLELPGSTSKLVIQELPQDRAVLNPDTVNTSGIQLVQESASELRESRAQDHRTEETKELQSQETTHKLSSEGSKANPDHQLGDKTPLPSPVTLKSETHDNNALGVDTGTSQGANQVDVASVQLRQTLQPQGSPSQGQNVQVVQGSQSLDTRVTRSRDQDINAQSLDRTIDSQSSQLQIGLVHNGNGDASSVDMAVAPSQEAAHELRSEVEIQNQVGYHRNLEGSSTQAIQESQSQREEQNIKAREVQQLQELQSSATQTHTGVQNSQWELRGFQSQDQSDDGRMHFKLQGGEFSQTQEVQGSQSHDDARFQQSQMQYNAQNEQERRSQLFRRDDSQTLQNFQSQNMHSIQSQNSQQFGSQYNQNVNSTHIQRFDSSEEHRRLQYQENQWWQTQRFNSSERYDVSSEQRVDSNAFRTSRFDSSESNWNQHVNHLSWASGMVQQSVRSSNSVDEFGHEAVENNLFY